MATIEPVALRFVLPELTGEVPSPPHDALSATARRQHLADHPRSYLGVTRSPDDIEDGSSDPAADALLAGRRHLEVLLADGVFGPTSEPNFFIYRLELDGHRQTGLVCGVATADYDIGMVRIHERINQSRADHLATHMRVVGAQSSPIALAFKSRPEVVALISETVETSSPFLDFIDDQGLRQQLWAVADSEGVELVRDRLANAPLYLIDGHHRAAAASKDKAGSAQNDTADLEQAASASNPAGPHLMLSTLFPYEELRSQAFHRFLTGLDSDFLPRLTARFSSRETDDPETVAERSESELAFGTRVQGPGDSASTVHWTLLDVPLDVHASSDLDNIDPIRLTRQVLGPMLGIDEGTSDPRLSYRPGLADADSIAEITLNPDETIFLMRPVPMDVLMDASDEGLVMPPKSTYFMPKVRSGLFVRLVDESLS